MIHEEIINSVCAQERPVNEVWIIRKAVKLHPLETGVQVVLEVRSSERALELKSVFDQLGYKII
jgi:hypothetical protein